MRKTLPLPQPQPMLLGAGSRPLPFIPRSMEEALTLAKAVVAARMAPRGMETPEACLVAILHGLEVGLTPLMALQRIAVIEGRPTIWGEGAMALVRASGLARSLREWVEGDTPDTWQAQCEVLRKGECEPVTTCFSVADARRAGLWGKPGPWSSYPRRMLQMRARAFALRDVFADVLGGLYLREEIEDGLGREACERIAEPDHAVAAPRVAHHPARQNGRAVADAEQADAPKLRGTADEPTRTKLNGGTRAEAQQARPDAVGEAPARSPRSLARRLRGSSTWVRLKPPREAIRLRAPPPPEYESLDSAADALGQHAGMLHADRLRDTAAMSTPAEALALYDDALACAQDDASLSEIEDEFAARLARLSREHRGEADRIRLRHHARIADLVRTGAP
ncbi:MAG: hypothetical protein U1E62_08045 [Alsobacter sp.]